MTGLTCGCGWYVRIGARRSARGHCNNLRHAEERTTHDAIRVTGRTRLRQSYVAEQSTTKGGRIPNS